MKLSTTNRDAQGSKRSLTPRAASLTLLLPLAAFYFLLEFVPNLWGGYGYFIDELYYIACSQRPAWGYVDHPPLSVWILAGIRAVLGSSPAAIRFLPALFGAATVFMTGWIARRLGAGLFGQALAAVAYMAAAVPMVMFGFYTMNALQMLIWAGLLYLLVLIVDGGSPRLWIWFGVLAGFGLQNKHTLVLLAAGLMVGLLLSPARKHLLERRLWSGGFIAFLILLPNVLWQIQNGWPSLEFYRNAALLKNLPASPWDVLVAQILYMNPIGAAVWLPGLLFLLLSGRAASRRSLGWLFLTLLAILMLSGQSRPDRITGAYPVVFAAGGFFWEAFAARFRVTWIRWALLLPLVVSGLLLVPLAIPVLPPAQAARYAAWTGMVPQMERGPGKKAELPQWFADRFGWQELARDVAKAYYSLSEQERGETVILAPSYGHAGALELYGPRYGLPPVCSPHNNYHLWGLPDRPVRTVISLGYGPDEIGSLFEDMQEVGVYQCDYCMRWRDDMSIYVARRPRVDLGAAWEDFKHFE